MKRSRIIITSLLLSASLFAQQKPIKDARVQGHWTMEAGSIFDFTGGTLIGLSGIGTITGVNGSGGTTGLTLLGGASSGSVTLTLGGILSTANGGTGTAAPGLIAGPNITISGSWPNQTISSSAGAGTWGTITGSILNQTDLQAALGAKQDALTFPQSVINSSGSVTLANDSASPGNLYFYGTDPSGTKGFVNLQSQLLNWNPGNLSVGQGNPFVLTQTWGSTLTTFTGLQMNITDNNSASASKLLDLKVGGASKFTVKKDGSVTVGSWAATPIANGSLANSSVTIAGTALSLGGTLTLDQITGLNSTGIVKRTGLNTFGIAISGTDYQAPGSYVLTSRNVNTTSPLVGGGSLGGDLNLALQYTDTDIATTGCTTSGGACTGGTATLNWSKRYYGTINAGALTIAFSPTSPGAGIPSLVGDVTFSQQCSVTFPGGTNINSGDTSPKTFDATLIHFGAKNLNTTTDWWDDEFNPSGLLQIGNNLNEIAANGTTAQGLARSNILALDRLGAEVLDKGAFRNNIGIDVLGTVQVVATSNLSLSGFQTVNGYTLVANDRILLTGQTTASQNGVWVAASGAWSRPTDFPTGGTFQTRTAWISPNDNTYAKHLFVCSNSSVATIGTTSLTWTDYGGGGGGGTITLSGEVTGTGTNSIATTVKRINSGANPVVGPILDSVPLVSTQLPRYSLANQQTTGFPVSFPTQEVSTVVADGTNYNSNPSILIDPYGRLQVYYRQGTSNTTGVAYKRAVSNNNGATWTTTTLTAPIPGLGGSPTPQDSGFVLMRNGVIAAFATMANLPSPNPVQLTWFATSTDYGETWSSWVQIPNGPFYTGSNAAHVQAHNIIEGKNGELLMTVYGLYNSGDTKESVALYRSYDLGATWTWNTIVSTPSTTGYNETNLYYIPGALMAFARNNLGGPGRFTSTDDGVTWSAATTPNLGPIGYLASPPDMFIANGITHLFYRSTGTSPGTGDTAEAVSYDYGVTWSGPNSRGVYAGRYEYGQTIAQGGTAIAVVGHSTATGGSGTVSNVVIRTWPIGSGVNLNGEAAFPSDVKSAHRVFGGQVAAGTKTTTYSLDVTAGQSWTLTTTASNNLAITPTSAGIADQSVTIIITSDATGGDVVTFASPFKPNGTMTLTASKVHTIRFVSDGNFLYEISRTAGL